MSMGLLLLSPMVKQRAKSRLFSRRFCATFLSRHDSGVHIRSSLRGNKSNWEDITKTSEKVIDNNVDFRILESNLPSLLLECIHSENVDSGPLAGRLLERARKNGRPPAELMQMVNRPSALDIIEKIE